MTKLDVEGNKLTMLYVNVIASWTMLTEFNAAKNSLSVMLENIGRLSRLIHLDIHQNRISSFPPSISGCSSLVELYMGFRNNVLSTLPSLPLLATLDIRSNQCG